MLSSLYACITEDYETKIITTALIYITTLGNTAVSGDICVIF
jgi:hypothetical protein